MAKVVAALASSHAPLMARAWEVIGPERLADIKKTFAEMGRRLKEAKPDVLVVISPDHWVNFFINNLPSVCICVGETHDGPPEPWMKDVPYKVFPGHPRLGLHLAGEAFKQGFEPSLSYHLQIDHGIAIPLWRMGIPPTPTIVPIIVNTVEPPLMTVRRAAEWGRFIRRAIESYPEDLRVGIMATGGLSHSIGEPDMGAIYEQFDLECLELMKAGGVEPVVEYLEKNIESAGNGAAEIRNWVMAHSAVNGSKFDLIGYHPYPEWYVGNGFGTWNLSGV